MRGGMQVAFVTDGAVPNEDLAGLPRREASQSTEAPDRRRPARSAFCRKTRPGRSALAAELRVGKVTPALLRTYSSKNPATAARYASGRFIATVCPPPSITTTCACG